MAAAGRFWVATEDELGLLHGLEVTLETLDGPTPYRAGDRVIIRETIRDAGTHNGSDHRAEPLRRFRRRAKNLGGNFLSRKRQLLAFVDRRSV